MDESGHPFDQTLERRSTDRRAGERRMPCRRFDPLFAATLVNHVALPERPHCGGAYSETRPAPRGLFVNVRV